MDCDSQRRRDVVGLVLAPNGDKFPSMASDRTYMRNEYERPRTTMLVWIVSAISAAFVLQFILGSPKLGAANRMLDEMVLTIGSIKQWHLWTLLTHGLLHDIQSFWHVLFTILGLIFVGRALEPLIGSRRFLGLFVSSLVFSGLCWCAVHWSQGGAHIGAGAAVFAFLVVLSEVNASTEMTLLFFPVSFRLRHIILVLLAIESLALIFYEIPGARVPLGLSPSAHLGGMLAGWLFFKFVHTGVGWDRAMSFSLPGWLRFKGRKRGTPAANTSSAPWRSGNLRADVDRILDKINSHGFGSLSDEEKQILDDAKDLLSKH
jgi:membrane associated rhomboid family serine protease